MTDKPVTITVSARMAAILTRPGIEDALESAIARTRTDQDLIAEAVAQSSHDERHQANLAAVAARQAQTHADSLVHEYETVKAQVRDSLARNQGAPVEVHIVCAEMGCPVEGGAIVERVEDLPPRGWLCRQHQAVADGTADTYGSFRPLLGNGPITAQITDRRRAQSMVDNPQKWALVERGSVTLPPTRRGNAERI